VFPSKILKWHYRSRHESLIAFSNAEYYDYSLLYVPSPTDTEELGINWRYVEGVYDRGKSRKNRIEAREVAQSIIEHARKHSNLSLGIGTLNRPQAEAIEEELEILRASNQDTEPFFTKKVFRGQVEEPFFIKNLENIQGDERDVIMISIGFGKDRDGILYQNFGPLQNDGGWRRLNVLVTRARQRIELFSSMRADEIEISPGRNMSGSAALKRYLAFAESKILDQPKETGREPDSPFEEAVIRLLHREGFQVTPQLGVRGFYIDIAVHHPKMPGKYILAVECDGATYHSLRSTRDRDRLREAALVSQGWRVHRIWSTSWFANPEEERKRLLHAISESVK
jgi:very-short-patch-repair endonuclease